MNMRLNQHLQSIKIEGFKSIKSLNLEMRSINLLIGANGAGKSNFMSIFTFLNQLSKGKLQSYIAKQGGTGRLLHFSAKNTPSLVINLELGDDNYHLHLKPDTQDSLIIDNERFFTDTQTMNLQNNSSEIGWTENKDLLIISNVRRIKTYFDECRVYHFFDTGEYADFKQRSQVSNYHYLEKDAANIGALLYFLKNNEEKRHRQAYYRIVTAVKAVAPYFHDFYLEPDGEGANANIILRWEHSEHDAPLSASMLSDGTARFICLATLIRQPEDLIPQTVILDEPELGLHPDAIYVLAEMIKDVSSVTQFIISTQSVEFANYFEPEDIIVVEETKGVSSFKRLEREHLEVWLDNFRMGELWTRNLIGGNPAC